ncbi:MAG: heme-binding domain-containing protein [Phycisphaeraceae bacterium]|nr:heme-binding domain-containing protein [Phycisphaeraceae bacterium]
MTEEQPVKPKKSKLRRIALIVVGVLLLVAVGIQFRPVNRSNPPVTMVVDAPPQVMSILKRSCFDCHSNETVWPWYSYVAPVSWLVADDVEEGREHVNFSAWDGYDAEDRADLIGECWKEVSRGKMPLKKYLRMHPDAALSQEDLVAIAEWAGADPTKPPSRGGHRPDHGESEHDEH